MLPMRLSAAAPQADHDARGRSGSSLQTARDETLINALVRAHRWLPSIESGKAKPCRDETLIKALVRAHGWRRRIETGQAKSITDLAEQEGVTVAYVCRLLPLTCLAPDIVEAIPDGRQPKGLRLADLLGDGSVGWEERRRQLSGTDATDRLAEARAPGRLRADHRQL